MTIEWLAGNRIRGTTAERPEFGLPSGSVGGWVELGRQTASGGETALTVSSLTDKRYYQVITTDHGISGAPARLWRFNNDSGSNYARRVNWQGGSDGTSINQTSHNSLSVNNTSQNLSIHHIANLSNKEKLQITHSVGGSSSASSVAPDRGEFVGKWANTSDAINRIDYIANAGSFSSGDELIVLGWDPADTHTTNFWEELASVDLSGGVSDTLSSGTFTAKKYLWVQCYLKSNATTPTSKIRVGNSTVDSGNNYAERYNLDGASDGTANSIDELDAGDTIGTGESEFHNMFIVNNASNEKLMIHNRVGNDSGTGASTAPNRRENVFKWANTSNQINILQFKADSGTYATNSILKVWGSD